VQDVSLRVPRRRAVDRTHTYCTLPLKVPVTQPQDLKNGQALVKLAFSGVCHTDLHAMLGDWPL